MIAAQVKYQAPSRAFSRGRLSTFSTTLASRPIPDEKVKWRPDHSPSAERCPTRARSTRRGRQSSAMRSRCSVASTISPGMPSSLQNTLVAPPGRQVSGTSPPARPLAASLTVPSPPKATTTS